MTREQLLAAMKVDPDRYDLTKEHRGLTCYGASRSGGHLCNIPEPHVRLFDVPGFVRRVKVTVTKYILGSHHYVKIEEQENPLWLPREADDFPGLRTDRAGVWTKAWDDHDARGRDWEQRYTRIHFIEPFIERTLAEHFKDIRHYVERETLGATAYGRDGD